MVFQVRRFRQLQNQRVELGQFYFLGGLRQRQDNLKARSRGMDNYVMSSMPQSGLKFFWRIFSQTTPCWILPYRNCTVYSAILYHNTSSFLYLSQCIDGEVPRTSWIHLLPQSFKVLYWLIQVLQLKQRVEHEEKYKCDHKTLINVNYCHATGGWLPLIILL